MKHKIMAIFFALTLCSGSAMADKGASKHNLDAYTWYDGGKPKQVWLDRSLLAEFGSRAESGSRAVVDTQGVRVWRAEEQAAARAKAHGKTSPVLRDAPGGAMRALPGNVIVRLNPSLGEMEVSQWLAAQGLVDVGRLGFGKNILIVRSAPGLASLELANRLQASGTVLSAQPEWWQQMESR